VSQPELAVVIIGRNEGERLRTCLLSAKTTQMPVTLVYVDSGSTDQSVALALSLGCDVVQLDLTRPFTAARARNEGFARAIQVNDGLKYVQFVDGDCELVARWLETAVDFLKQNPKVAAACGRRRERYPEHSVFNQLCDMEWNSPIGQTRSCGGDVMLRAGALQEVDGYRPNLIAGEEPELCVRLRAKGWTVWRLDNDMTMHDAAITRLGQWWNRTRRAGYAFAQGAALHGAPPERHCVKELQRTLVWGVFLPAFILLVSLGQPVLLLLFLVYPAQVLRLRMSSQVNGSIAWWRALYLVLGKFAEAQGALKFFASKFSNKSATLIEYK
jgi:GT2 family glycosyltransferase